MTKEEAIQELQEINTALKSWSGFTEYPQALYIAIEMAIEALQGKPQGEWINREHCQVDEDAYEVATCSNCKTEITLEYPCDRYCPNCGADMRGDTE